jgi:2-methylcitrate dehydratase PrpD
MADRREPGATERALDGVEELRALAAYVAAPTADVLAGPATALWASARLLDSLGNISHGSAAPISAAVRTAVDPADGKGIAAWPDLDGAYRPDDAGLLLGVYAISENYCDTGLGSVAHPGSIVIPALLIAAQERVVTGRDALAAVAVGYNVMEYLGATVNGGRPRMASQLKGFRPTASAGPVAAIAVLARLAGLSPEECHQALALGCSQGGGLRRSPIAPTAAIRIQSGEAVRRAVQTLRLSRAGIAAHPDMLRAPGGFFAAYGNGELGHVQVPRAGTDGFLASASMKLDCTPHTLVTALDAVRKLAAHPGKIAAIEVWVPAQHHAISGDAKPLPRTFPEGANHAPFCLALAAIQHAYLYPAVVTQGLFDPRVRALAERVSVTVDDRLTSVFDRDPSSWPARTRIQWHNGATSELELLRPETADWSAHDALDAAAAKVAAILGDQAGTTADLAGRYATAESWLDLWAGLCADPLTRARLAMAQPRSQPACS